MYMYSQGAGRLQERGRGGQGSWPQTAARVDVGTRRRALLFIIWASLFFIISYTMTDIIIHYVI